MKALIVLACVALLANIVAASSKRRSSRKVKPDKERSGSKSRSGSGEDSDSEKESERQKSSKAKREPSILRVYTRGDLGTLTLLIVEPHKTKHLMPSDTLKMIQASVKSAIKTYYTATPGLLAPLTHGHVDFTKTAMAARAIVFNGPVLGVSSFVIDSLPNLPKGWRLHPNYTQPSLMPYKDRSKAAKTRDALIKPLKSRSRTMIFDLSKVYISFDGSKNEFELNPFSGFMSQAGAAASSAGAGGRIVGKSALAKLEQSVRGRVRFGSPPPYEEAFHSAHRERGEEDGEQPGGYDWSSAGERGRCPATGFYGERPASHRAEAYSSYIPPRFSSSSAPRGAPSSADPEPYGSLGDDFSQLFGAPSQLAKGRQDRSASKPASKSASKSASRKGQK